MITGQEPFPGVTKSPAICLSQLLGGRKKADVSWGGESFLPLNGCPLSLCCMPMCTGCLLSILYNLIEFLEESYEAGTVIVWILQKTLGRQEG